MHRVKNIPQEQLAEFVVSVLQNILKKEYPMTYSGADILTSMQFELEQQCTCGSRYMKIRSKLKDLIA
jgi:hypothetical protein